MVISFELHEKWGSGKLIEVVKLQALGARNVIITT
jgi:hypothetical protein